MRDALQKIDLGGQDYVLRSSIRSSLVPSTSEFELLWNLHPSEFSRIKMHGRSVAIPRWQQAYGRDYRFSGGTSVALPVPSELKGALDWSQKEIDPRLNGLLLNWYDGALGHYIGKHRDSRTGLISGSPIVTISFGETRTMRLRKWRGSESTDIELDHGSVLVIPCATNLGWTHEITKSARAKDRRVSLTIRAFA